VSTERRPTDDPRGAARERVADAEVPGWVGGVMLALRWVTLLVEVNVMVLLGTLAGGVVGGLGPALRAGSAVVARMTDEPTPWRTFWRTWRSDLGRTNLLFAPFWVVAVLLWFDGIAVTLLDGPPRAILLGGLIVVLAWTAVTLCYWPRVTLRYDRPFAETWRFLLLSPLLGPATSLAVLVVLGVVWVAWTFLPVAAVLVGSAFALWATGRLVGDRLDRLDADAR
jgi:uncharacterized membrane protein YesL